MFLFRYLFLTLLLLNCLRADIIYLKNGNGLHGEVIKRTADYIVVKVAFGNLTIPKNSVSRIESEDSIENIVNQGERLISLGAVDHALRYYEKSLKENPGNKVLEKIVAEAYQYGAKYFIKEKSFIKARYCVKKAKQHNPQIDIKFFKKHLEEIEKQAALTLLKANKLLKQRKSLQALKLYFTILNDFPHWYDKVVKNLAYAAIIEGDKNLRLKKLNEARKFYNLSLEYWGNFFPYIEKRWLYVNTQWVINNLYKQKKWDKMEIELEKIRKISPTSRAILFLIAAVKHKKGDFSSAYSYYSQIAGDQKLWNGSFIEFEKIYERAKKKSGITFLHGSSPCIPMEESFKGKWEVTSVKNYRIYHQNLKFAKRLISTMEYHIPRIIARLAPDGFNISKKNKYTIFLYPSKQMYISKSQANEWTEGNTSIMYIGRRAFNISISLYQSAPLLFSNILPHELTHALYPGFMKHRNIIPLWLNEGIAITSETAFRKKSRLRSLKMYMKRGKVFPLSKLVTMENYPRTEKGANLFYAQSFSIVNFLLRRYGKDALLEFVTALNHTNADQAIRKVYHYSGLGSFENVWLSSLK